MHLDWPSQTSLCLYTENLSLLACTKWKSLDLLVQIKASTTPRHSSCQGHLICISIHPQIHINSRFFCVSVKSYFSCHIAKNAYFFTIFFARRSSQWILANPYHNTHQNALLGVPIKRNARFRELFSTVFQRKMVILPGLRYRILKSKTVLSRIFLAHSSATTHEHTNQWPYYTKNDFRWTLKHRFYQYIHTVVFTYIKKQWSHWSNLSYNYLKQVNFFAVFYNESELIWSLTLNTKYTNIRKQRFLKIFYYCNIIVIVYHNNDYTWKHSFTRSRPNVYYKLIAFQNMLFECWFTNIMGLVCKTRCRPNAEEYNISVYYKLIAFQNMLAKIFFFQIYFVS